MACHALRVRLWPSLRPIQSFVCIDSFHRAVAAGLRLTLAPSTSTPIELSWQWKDSRARMIVVAPTHYRAALEMLVQVLRIPRHEAQQRIWVMDRLWEYGQGSDGIVSDGWNRVKGLIGHGRLEEEEKFEHANADETVYICYSSGTTVSTAES